jgi:D-glycero-alpha-D-manno-heptose 1-phosphate guanylyltransferase
MNLSEFSAQYDMSVACRYVENADRYGLMEIKNGLITAMHEKQSNSAGYINGGVYLIRRDMLQAFPDKFSFETVALPQFIAGKSVGAILSDAYFIDIGIPEDYKRAIDEL